MRNYGPAYLLIATGRVKEGVREREIVIHTILTAHTHTHTNHSFTFMHFIT